MTLGSMSLLIIGIVTVLAVVIIIAKTSRDGPKKVSKREKGEILKQLLALSDHESGISAAADPARTRTITTNSSTPRGQSRQNPSSQNRSGKITHPIRSSK